MAQGSRICPHCGGLNGIDEKSCYRCSKRLPGAIAGSVSGLAAEFSADGVPGTKLMAGVCILVFGLCLLTDGGASGLPIFGSFRSSTTIRFGALLGLFFASEPWRLLSAVFVHASLLHIGMNLLGIINLGRALEPHFRTARFLVLYLMSGLLGYVATLYWRGERAFSVGASGALFGLLGAYIAVLLIRRNPGWHRVFVSNLILAFALAYFSSRAGDGGSVPQIDNAAHIGGFVSGFVIGLLFERERRPQRRDRWLAIPAVVLVLASLTSIGLSATSPIWSAVRAREEAARLGHDSE
ncbi:MAG TPA: rhomboid family intramembrane serine protease [Polyangiaceae bacterium]|nr:rhomboid family intramembrane serine protease [Polyangiaceae bacterium]